MNHQFKELIVWQKAIDHVSSIYRVTQFFPVEETYGLKSQLCRCAVSIPSNIAEGSGRESVKEFIRFLNIALSSCYEMETQLIISEKLDIISTRNVNDLLERTRELQKMLFSFRRNLSSSISQSHVS